MFHIWNQKASWMDGSLHPHGVIVFILSDESEPIGPDISIGTPLLGIPMPTFPAWCWRVFLACSKGGAPVP